MSTKVIYLAGVPASGKTTIFKRIRERLFTTCTDFKSGLCRGIENGQYKMIGVFDGSTFEGTDRLSMAVIDDAIDYIKQLDNAVVFVEGDRLFNYRFLQAVKASVIIIDAHPDVLHIRHAQRGDAQSEIFLKGRRSKIENFAKKYKLKRLYNNTNSDSERITDFIISIAEKHLK